jgi:hypothetical protein
MAMGSNNFRDSTEDRTRVRRLPRVGRSRLHVAIVLLSCALACGSNNTSHPNPGGGSDAATGDGAVSTGSPDASGDGAANAGGCTRADLTAAIDSYYKALAAHDPSMAPLASNVKYTESGTQLQIGDGEWKTAGAVTFKRSALDTQLCMSATESVIGDASGDLVYGVRLKVEGQKITEIETIPVHNGNYILVNPQGLASTSGDDWETVLPADQQATRDDLQAFIDTYFTQFPNGACNFAADCKRVEDGGTIPGSCTGLGVGCSDAGPGRSTMKARLHVIDVEAGITVGFTMFAGTYTDFHMFKVRAGQVHGVHALLASASSSGWD